MIPNQQMRILLCLCFISVLLGSVAAQSLSRCDAQKKTCDASIKEQDVLTALRAVENGDSDVKSGFATIKQVQWKTQQDLHYLAAEYVFLISISGNESTSDSQELFTSLSQKQLPLHLQIDLYDSIRKLENGIADARLGILKVSSATNKAPVFKLYGKFYLELLRHLGNEKTTEVIDSFEKWKKHLAYWTIDQIVSVLKGIQVNENGGEDTRLGFQLVLDIVEKCGDLKAVGLAYIDVLKRMGSSKTSETIAFFKGQKSQCSRVNLQPINPSLNFSEDQTQLSPADQSQNEQFDHTPLKDETPVSPEGQRPKLTDLIDD